MTRNKLLLRCFQLSVGVVLLIAVWSISGVYQRRASQPNPTDLAPDKETLRRRQLKMANPLYSDKVTNPHPFVLLDRARPCDELTDGGGVFLVVLVASRPQEFGDRTLIRNTWGSVRNYRNRTVLVRFLIAHSPNKSFRRLVASESNIYKDIVQENFTDSYHNMTYKILMGLRWAASRCPNATYVMNLDSDMFVNVFNVVEHLESAPRTDYAAGRYKPDELPMRSPKWKWYTPVELYPESTYPPYLNGPCYVMSNDLPRRIFQESAHVRYIPWDDVYVGLVMKKLGVRPREGGNFELYITSWNFGEVSQLFRVGKAICVGHELETSNHEHAELVRAVWKDLRSRKESVKKEGDLSVPTN